MNEIVKEIITGILWLITLTGVWLSLGTVLAFVLAEMFGGNNK